MSGISITTNMPKSDLPGIIARSAQRTGVDFSYLMAQAQLESGMRPDAKASTSSATGLYQFIEQTWLGLVKEKGGKYGLGWAQDAIQQGRGGRFYVSDQRQQANILALRNDSEISANLAGEFAADNRDYLYRRTGRNAEPVDLYLAHFLGAAGAGKFLEKWTGNPDASGAALFPKAAKANRNIFYDRAGQPRSLDDIRSRFESKLAAAAASVADGKALPASGNNLPAHEHGPNMVQPADYLRIARAHRDNPDESRIASISEAARSAYLHLSVIGSEQP